jgi:hypothetical protein
MLSTRTRPAYDDQSLLFVGAGCWWKWAMAWMDKSGAWRERKKVNGGWSISRGSVLYMLYPFELLA